jgi:uncharacterized protein
MNEFFSAVNKGDIELVSRLLDSGIDVNIQEKHGRTPLMDAVINKNEELVKILVQRGANVNLQDARGLSALHFASQNYQLEIIRVLIINNVEIDIQDINGNTPLSDAVFNSKGKGEVISLLIENGANRDLVNKYGMSPLQLAKTISNYDVLQYIK